MSKATVALGRAGRCPGAVPLLRLSCLGTSDALLQQKAVPAAQAQPFRHSPIDRFQSSRRAEVLFHGIIVLVSCANVLLESPWLTLAERTACSAFLSIALVTRNPSDPAFTAKSSFIFTSPGFRNREHTQGSKSTEIRANLG